MKTLNVDGTEYIPADSVQGSVQSKNVWQKYLMILSSTRFHQLLMAFAISVLSHYGYIDPWLANSITLLIASSVTINTVDRFSNGLSSIPDATSTSQKG